MWKRIGWTPCNDGAIVSTVDLYRYGIETAVWVGDDITVVEKYSDKTSAITGHSRHVRLHFGPLGLFWRILLGV